MSEQQKAPRAVQYIGHPKTRQVWGRWLEPGEIISSPAGMVLSLSVLPDFQIVDTTLAKPEEELPVEEEEV